MLCTVEECGLGCIQLDGLKGSIFKKLVSHCHARIYEGAKADVDAFNGTTHISQWQEVVTVDSA